MQFNSTFRVPILPSWKALARCFGLFAKYFSMFARFWHLYAICFAFCQKYICNPVQFLAPMTINSGQQYHNSYATMIWNPDTDFLMLIIFSCNKTKISSIGWTSCWPLMFTTTILNQVGEVICVGTLGNHNVEVCWYWIYRRFHVEVWWYWLNRSSTPSIGVVWIFYMGKMCTRINRVIVSVWRVISGLEYKIGSNLELTIFKQWKSEQSFA